MISSLGSDKMPVGDESEWALDFAKKLACSACKAPISHTAFDMTLACLRKYGNDSAFSLCDSSLLLSRYRWPRFL